MQVEENESLLQDVQEYLEEGQGQKCMGVYALYNLKQKIQWVAVVDPMGGGGSTEGFCHLAWTLQRTCQIISDSLPHSPLTSYVHNCP